MLIDWLNDWLKQTVRVLYIPNVSHRQKLDPSASIPSQWSRWTVSSLHHRESTWTYSRSPLRHLRNRRISWVIRHHSTDDMYKTEAWMSSRENDRERKNIVICQYSPPYNLLTTITFLTLLPRVQEEAQKLPLQYKSLITLVAQPISRCIETPDQNSACAVWHSLYEVVLMLKVTNVLF